MYLLADSSTELANDLRFVDGGRFLQELLVVVQHAPLKECGQALWKEGWGGWFMSGGSDLEEFDPSSSVWFQTSSIK
jgi:hypothetical protein